MINTLIQPKLGLSKKTDAALLEYANNIVVKLELHESSFPGIDIDALKAARDNYNAKLSVVQHGTPAATAAKNDARVVLENILRNTANDCAAIADGNEALFLLSGFEIKSKPTPSGLLPAPDKFNIKVGPFDGSLEVIFKSVKNAYSYEIFYGENLDNPDSWTKFKVTTAGRIVIGELQSGVFYSARVRAVGTKGKKGTWSEIVTRKTY